MINFDVIPAMAVPLCRDDLVNNISMVSTKPLDKPDLGKLVLENGDDGETFSSSSKRPTVPAPEVHVPVADHSHPQDQTGQPVQVKRKTLSRSRQDRVRWRVWLERKLEETKQSTRSRPLLW